MHIVDGALSTPILACGLATSIVGVAIGLRKIDSEQVPLVGLLTATFFIASYIHLPLGLSNVHLVLNGLMGLLLGWAAFPALLIGLLLQAVFFGFGGIVVLGVNLANVAIPAVAVFYLCRVGILSEKPKLAAMWGAIAGAGAILLTALMVAASLALSGENFVLAAKLTVVGHIPIMLIEGFVTGAAVMLIRQVKPELIGIPDKWENASA